MNHLRLVLLASTAIATLSLSWQLVYADANGIVLAQQDIRKEPPGEFPREDQGQSKRPPKADTGRSSASSLTAGDSAAEGRPA